MLASRHSQTKNLLQEPHEFPPGAYYPHHQIRPIPPMYVTEYEAAFKWPIQQETAQRSKEIISPISPWAIMKQAQIELKCQNYESNTSPIIKEINDRKLGPNSKAAYENAKKHLDDHSHKYPKYIKYLYKQYVRSYQDILNDVNSND